MHDGKISPVALLNASRLLQYAEQKRETDPEGALRSINRALDLDPTCHRCYSLKARLLFDLGDDDKVALKDAQNACELKKDDPDSLAIRSAIEHRLGYLPKALADIDAALKMNPINFYFEQKARILVSQGKWLEAEQNASAGLRARSTAAIHFLRTDIAAHLKHWPIVIQDATYLAYSKESSVQQRAHGFQMLITAYRETKQTQAAKTACLDALRLDPDDWVVAKQASDYFASIGDTANAARASAALHDLGADLAAPKQ